MTIAKGPWTVHNNVHNGTSAIVSAGGETIAYGVWSHAAAFSAVPNMVDALKEALLVMRTSKRSAARLQRAIYNCEDALRKAGVS